VVVNYAFIGTDGKALDIVTPFSFEGWNEMSLNVTLTVPERAVKLNYFVNITDRGGNEVGIENSLLVQDIILPQVIIRPEGNASTGEDLLLNVTVKENTFNGELELLYRPLGDLGPGSILCIGLGGEIGTIVVHPSIPIAVDMVKVQLRARCTDEALNVFEGDVMVINVSDIVPPTIRKPEINIKNNGLLVHFNVYIVDNIKITSVDLSLNCSGGKNIRGDMVGNGHSWELSLPLPLDAIWCDWTISARDTSGNEARSFGRYKLSPVGPSVLSDLTNGTPKTGRPFELVFNERAGLHVGFRRIDWWFDTDQVMSEWNLSRSMITVPENASELHYRYSIKDQFDTIVSIVGGCKVLDVILPTFSLTTGEAYNGRTSVLPWSVIDNIGVAASFIRYRFDDLDWTMVEPSGVDLIIMIPLDAVSLKVEGHVNDTEGNINTTVLERNIIDDTPPALERIIKAFDERNDTLMVFLVCSDNRGLEQIRVRWSIGPGRSELMPIQALANGTFQGKVLLAGQEGELRIEVTLNDTSGNQMSF